MYNGCTTNDTHNVNYDKYFDDIHHEFPDCSFIMSLLRLDESFDKNDPGMIVIRDTRVLRDTFGFLSNPVKHDHDVSVCELRNGYLQTQ